MQTRCPVLDRCLASPLRGALTRPPTGQYPLGSNSTPQPHLATGSQLYQRSMIHARPCSMLRLHMASPRQAATLAHTTVRAVTTKHRCLWRAARAGTGTAAHGKEITAAVGTGMAATQSLTDTRQAAGCIARRHRSTAVDLPAMGHRVARTTGNERDRTRRCPHLDSWCG